MKPAWSAPANPGWFAAALLLLIGASLPAPVVGQMQTPHDFRLGNGVSAEPIDSYDAICVACHTPTGEIRGAAWDSEGASAQTYAMYSTRLLNATAYDSPSGVSLVCLSCHDGTSGPSVFVGQGHSLGPQGETHPVSIVYNELNKPGFRPGATVESRGLKLFSDRGMLRVECPTCHNPHDDQTGRPFLRLDNRGSQLCLTCHMK